MDLGSRICFLNKHNTKNNVFRTHSHNCYELVYFLTGTGSTVIGEQSHAVKEHAYCIIAPGTRHIECLEGYGEILFIGFTCKAGFAPLQEGVYRNGDLSKYTLLQDIFQEYKDQRPGYEIAGHSLLDLFLLSVLRESTAESKPTKDLQLLREYIGQHADQKINFKELAAVSGYSPDYFRRIFKERFGVSPQQYMIHIRLEQAKELLSTTDLSCTEIAYRCGFSNSAQLSTMFRERYGISPTALQRTDLYKN